MRSSNHNFNRHHVAAVAAALAVFAPAVAGAQLTQRIDRQAGRMAQVDPAKVGLDQRLNAALPADLTFRDETGKTVRLGDYLGHKPIVLNMIFYKCPGVCMRELEGMAALFSDKAMSLDLGRDFDAVTVSINPKETPEIAAAKKAEFVPYLRPGGANGWHFLVGDEPQIEKLAQAIGYRYAYDERTDSFAHPAGIIVITPSGNISRYFFSVYYEPLDVRLALVEASSNRIGSLADKIRLSNCIFQYDPRTGHYGLMVTRLVQVFGIMTFVTLATSIFIMSRVFTRQAIRAEQRSAPAGNTGDGTNHTEA